MTFKNMRLVFILFGCVAPIASIQKSGSAITTSAHQLSEQKQQDSASVGEQCIPEQSRDVSVLADSVFTATVIGATFAVAYYMLEDSFLDESACDRLFGIYPTL